MNELRSILLTSLSDEQWQKYCDASSEILRLYYPELTRKDKSWQDFKKEYLDRVEKNKENHYTEEIIFENGRAACWVDIWVDASSCYIGFNYMHDKIPENVLNKMLNIINNFLIKHNLNTAYMGYSDPRRIDVMKKIEAEIVEEFELNKLDRNDMQLETYDNIINSINLPEGFRLSVLKEFPENLMNKFIEFENPILEEINNINPSEVKILPVKRSDLIRQNSANKKNDIDSFIMIMTDEKDNILAICNTLIESRNKNVIRHFGGITAVDKSHRGKGYGRYIKSKMYKMFLEENNDFKYIATDTMPWNKYMYRINQEFGFKPYKHGYTFKLTKKFLENYLENY